MRKIALILSLFLIFSIPWEGMIEIPNLGTAAKLIGIVTAAFWLATVVITGRLRKPGPLQIMAYLFVVWNVVSVLWSADLNKTVAHIVTWAQLLGMIVILWDLYTTRAALLAGLQAFILGVYVALGATLTNYFAGHAYYTYYQRFSPAGETNPDGFGFIIVLGIPIAWYLATSMSTTKIGWLLKVVNYAYIPAAFLGIALSGTRTALIATVPAMVFGLASLTRLRLWIRIAIFVLLITSLFILLSFVQTLPSFQRLGTVGTELTSGDLNKRTGIWREGFASFTEHPFIGVGSNMFRSVTSSGKLAHNSFISVLVELGLIGFLLFGTIVMIAVIQAFRHPKWDSMFWLTLLAVWTIGSSTLTWEHRKPTWLFLSFVTISAVLPRPGDETVALAEGDKFVGQ